MIQTVILALKQTMRIGIRMNLALALVTKTFNVLYALNKLRMLFNVNNVRKSPVLIARIKLKRAQIICVHIVINQILLFQYMKLKRIINCVV